MTAMATDADETGASGSVEGGCEAKMAPMIHRKPDIIATPRSRGFFRPNRSTPNAMKMDVATILTIPYMPEASSDVDEP